MYLPLLTPTLVRVGVKCHQISDFHLLCAAVNEFPEKLD